MKKTFFLLISFLLISTLVNAQFCNKYADKAVAQYKLAKQNNLPNINWPVWSDDWNEHYNWCKNVSKDDANKQTALRKSYLNKYIKQVSPIDKQSFCNTYADTAIKQYTQAVQLQLPDMNPLLWNNNRDLQIKWCMAVPENTATQENNKRQKIIDDYLNKNQGKSSQNSNYKITKVIKGIESSDLSKILENVENICDHYAKESVRQQKVNLNNKCDFKGNLWNSNYKYHKNWSLQGENYLKTDKILADRERQLNKCMGKDILWVTGMVIGLRSGYTWKRDPFVPNSKFVKYANKDPNPYSILDGFFTTNWVMDKNDNSSFWNDDLPAPMWTYYTVRNHQNCKYRSAELYKLPPGIVIGLKTNEDRTIKVFGVDAFYGPEYLPEATFKKECGGDLGAKSGEGWCWYESSGRNFTDWSLVNNLPRGTVIGLKHSLNQPNKKLIWQGVVFDPVDPNIKPPPGFARKVGGDDGAPAGQGYFWYEKITGR